MSVKAPAVRADNRKLTLRLPALNNSRPLINVEVKRRVMRDCSFDVSTVNGFLDVASTLDVPRPLEPVAPVDTPIFKEVKIDASAVRKLLNSCDNDTAAARNFDKVRDFKVFVVLSLVGVNADHGRPPLYCNPSIRSPIRLTLLGWFDFA